jgi:hypothetical protein
MNFKEIWYRYVAQKFVEISYIGSDHAAVTDTTRKTFVGGLNLRNKFGDWKMFES